MAPKKKRTYQIKKTPTTDQVIAVPKSKAKGTPPRIIELEESDKKKLASYIRAKRAAARQEGIVKELIKKYGTLSYMDSTISGSVNKTYFDDAVLSAEIKALDERKTAARESGELTTTTGAMSLKFSDKKKKPAKLTAGKAGK